MRLIIGLSFLALLIMKCNAKIKRENNEMDIEKAKLVCLKYLSFAEKSNYDSALVYTVDTLSASIKDANIKCDSLLGSMVRYNFENGISTIECIENSCKGGFTVKFKLIRTKKNSTKIFYLQEKDNIIKIIGTDETYDL